jgi:hypothetical protein
MINFLRPVALTALTNSASSAELRDGWFIQTGLDVDRGVDDRQAIGETDLGDPDDVVDQQLPVLGGDRIHLHRLVVDNDQCRILRREQMIADGVTNRFTRHGVLSFLVA